MDDFDLMVFSSLINLRQSPKAVYNSKAASQILGSFMSIAAAAN